MMCPIVFTSLATDEQTTREYKCLRHPFWPDEGIKNNDVLTFSHHNYVVVAVDLVADDLAAQSVPLLRPRK